MVDYTKTAIINNAQIAAASQANAEPRAVSQLLVAIYDGMTSGFFTTGGKVKAA
jgi:hypothetical protein